MNPIRLLNLGVIPPLQTQSVYHALAEKMTRESQDVIIICRPSAPYLCLGYHQVFENTFDLQECERRGLPILRRRLGGGATYLDGSQLFYQCVFHHTRMPAMLNDIYALGLAAPVNTLKRLGLKAELRDTNEIEVDGRRIAGTGGGRIGEACVVVGNLLFDFDFEAMTAVWRTPSLSFRLLAEKALRQQLITLDQLAITTSLEEITEMLINEFSTAFHRHMQMDTLTAEEIESAEEASRELISDDFLSLHKERGIGAPMRSLKVSARAFIHADETCMNGYDVRGSFWVSQDHIKTAKLESEPAREWQATEKKLTGIPFNAWKEQIYV
jgi:lipoate---protein ligase